MKIGLVGSHCVGKTTLAQALSQQLSMPLIEEQMRPAQQRFSKIGYPTLNSIIDTIWYPHFVFDLIYRQVECEERVSAAFVTDRTVSDYYIYYRHLSTVAESQKDILKSFVLDRFFNQYDVIIYLPVAFAIASDGYRNIDPDFRIQMDIAVFETAKQHKGFLRLNAEAVDARIAEAVAFLEKKF